MFNLKDPFAIMKGVARLSDPLPTSPRHEGKSQQGPNQAFHRLIDAAEEYANRSPATRKTKEHRCLTRN
jgi:hypothetical protein